VALMALIQHHGRPGDPPIESFFGHIKTEWPHLDTITDAALLEAELPKVRTEYNSIRRPKRSGT
jgi:transposase InsO family protein